MCLIFGTFFFTWNKSESGQEKLEINDEPLINDPPVEDPPVDDPPVDDPPVDDKPPVVVEDIIGYAFEDIIGYDSIFDEKNRIELSKVQNPQLIDRCYFNASYDGHFHDPDIPRKQCKVSWIGKGRKGTWICSTFRREYCCQRYEPAGGYHCPFVPYDVEVSKRDQWKSDIVLCESRHWANKRWGEEIVIPGRNENQMFSIIQLESVDRFGAYFHPSFYTDKADKRVDVSFGFSYEFFNHTANWNPDLPFWAYLTTQKNRDYEFKQRKFCSVFISNLNAGCLNWQRVQFIRYFVRTSENLYEGKDDNKVVHSYGHVCNNRKFPTAGYNERYDVKEKLLNEYKFTLALENFIDDWTAGARIWGPLYNGAIPVVVGARNLHEMWPFKNKGYINVADFGDVNKKETWEKVMNYMYELSEDEEKWMEYQKWRFEEYVDKDWFMKYGRRTLFDYFCNLCQVYHEEFLPNGGHADLSTDKVPQSKYIQPYKNQELLSVCPKIDSDCGPL